MKHTISNFAVKKIETKWAQTCGNVGQVNAVRKLLVKGNMQYINRQNNIIQCKVGIYIFINL